MGKTVLVDLSHPFGRGNPLWPSNGDFHIDRVQHMPMHYRLLQTFNDFHMHNSTHADSPSHVIPESPYTHELPLEKYYGPAVCLDIPKKHWELITVEDIEKAAAKVEGGIQEGDWVLICTGMNQRWGENDDYFMYSPGMSIEGAHWLVDHKVKGVGFDLQALDHILYTYAAQHGPAPTSPASWTNTRRSLVMSPSRTTPSGSRCIPSCWATTSWVLRTWAATSRR